MSTQTEKVVCSLFLLQSFFGHFLVSEFFKGAGKVNESFTYARLC